MTKDFFKEDWKEMLGTKEEFERHQEIEEKERVAAEIELGGTHYYCPKCGDEVLGDTDGLCQNCI